MEETEEFLDRSSTVDNEAYKGYTITKENLSKKQLKDFRKETLKDIIEFIKYVTNNLD